MRDVVLITGAAGFVGTVLRETIQKTDTVVSMVRDRTRSVGGHSVVHGDVLDGNFCLRALADYGVTVVYHLAAQSIVSICAEDPISAIEIATLGTARLLQAVRDTGRPIRVCVMTSDKVFGAAPPPYDESTPLDARHAYEVSKACQDLVARMYHSNYGVDVRVVRAVNIYGPNDPNESRLIPQTVARCLRGIPPLVHAGAETMRRQYVFVDDVVSALECVRRQGQDGEVYCVGSLDAPLSVTDVIREIAKQVGVPFSVEVREREARFREIQEQAIDDRKIRALGWTPTVPFVEGIARTIKHAKRVFDGYLP